MLGTCILPLSLKESFKTIRSIASFIKDLGTERIFLSHIFEGKRIRQKQSEKMGDIAEELRGMDFIVSTHSRKGSVVDGIMDLTKELAPDFAALPWHNIDPLRRSLVGSIDIDIVRSIDIPALIYKKESISSDPGLSSIIYATNFQRTDSIVVPYLSGDCLHAGTLYLLHVGKRAPDPEADQKRRSLIRKSLDRLAVECRVNFNNVETIETVGSVRTEIVREAKRKKADMIIMGKTDSKKSIDRILGSTAESVAIKSHTNIILIPATGSSKSGSVLNG